jgi:hypothetical protein
MTNITRNGRSPYFVRYHFTYDGANPGETLTIPNPDLLDINGPLGLAAGALRNYWHVVGLSLAEAVARYLDSPIISHNLHGVVTPGFAPVPAFGIDVSVDVAGRPQPVFVFPLDFALSGEAEITFRHTIGR